MPALHVDAIVIADDPLARRKIAGLAAHERARRVALRVGAARVLVVDGASTRADVTAWLGAGPPSRPLLVIRANQLVHTPLVAPLVEAYRNARDASVLRAVGPSGDDGGAYLAAPEHARAAAEAIARGDNGAPEGASPVEHGEIARHAIGTPAERKAAHALLYRILVKPQDNVITRYVYRPISFPLTRLLVWTPVTPNQVSLFVAVLVAIGCWLTMSASYASVIAGTATILAASYVDCCDGEIARVKLLSSKFGAWIDTVIDELSSTAYIIALGYHCHLHYGRQYLGDDRWVFIALVTGALCLWSMFCIYYNIIVAVGSANSQDYVARFETEPGTTPNAVRLRPVEDTAERPQGALAKLLAFLPNIARRDFLTWLTLVLALAHVTQISFGLQVVGVAIMSIILTVDHVKLRRLRASLVRAGNVVEAARVSVRP